MTSRIRALLFAAVLVCTPVFAQDPPAPAKAPPRVPFSAFRMKPILEPHLVNPGSVVVSEPDSVPYRPLEREAAHKAVEEVANSPVPPLNISKMGAPIPLPKPGTAPARVVAPPDAPPPVIVWDETPDTAMTQSGIPVPPRKPGQESPQEPVVIERVHAEFSEEPLPRPPVAAEDDLTFQPPAKPETTVRIRERRNRFSSQQRTAGLGLDGSMARRSSTRLGGDSTPLRVGRLGQGDGVSPVLIPGHTITVAAPDAQRMGRGGVPNEVIVFFQENSPELEVGQLDIITTDVIEMMRRRSDLELEIVGYSEPQAGGTGATDDMAQRRAQMIYDYIARQRISGDRLTVRAKGDDTGIEPRDRVEMYFSR